MSSISNSTIPFTVKRGVNLSKLAESGKTFPNLERERAQHLIVQGKARALSKFNQTQEKKKGSSIPADVTMPAFFASVKIGSPPLTYKLLIDTGSSNTWIGLKTPYETTSTSTQTPDTVAATYGSGSFQGDEFTDQVALSQHLVIQKQSIGVARSFQGFSGFGDTDGFIGIGPTDLTVGTLSPDTTLEIPTLVDNLFSQKTIPSAVVSVFIEPVVSPTGDTTGELTFGGIDHTKITEPIHFGLDASVYYGEDIILNTTAGIVDTGSTLVELPSDTIKKYMSATGAVLDTTSMFFTITEAQLENLKPLSFCIGGKRFPLTPNAQLVPRFGSTTTGGDADPILLAIGDIGQPSGQGLDFILGQTFLERYYSVFDTSNNRIGLARTAFTDATTN